MNQRPEEMQGMAFDAIDGVWHDAPYEKESDFTV
jgi:hypothetical protein